MKPLTSAAVFGLVPVPPMSATDTHSDRDSCVDIWPLTLDDASAPRLAEHRHEPAERMATNDGLARIRQELEDLSAESRL